MLSPAPLKSPLANPLTDQDCENARCVAESVPAIENLLQRCENCGFGVAGLREHLKKQQHNAEQILRNFAVS
jgi:hypothetical protein